MGFFSNLTTNKEQVDYRNAIVKRYKETVVYLKNGMDENEDDNELDFFSDIMKLMLKNAYSKKHLNAEQLEDILDAEVTPFLILVDKEPKLAVNSFIDYHLFKAYENKMDHDKLKKAINYSVLLAYNESIETYGSDSDLWLWTLKNSRNYSVDWIKLLTQQSNDILNKVKN